METSRPIHLSATSIAAFKSCPQRFRIGYVEGIRLVEDTDAQRQGTNWHKLHELTAKTSTKSAADWLTDLYATVPPDKTPLEWEMECITLLASFTGYQWYWDNDPIESIADELPFELPLREPQIGLPIPITKVLRVGKIDQIARYRGAIYAVERKSTSKSIEAYSDFWDRWRKDTQISMYALAFRDLGIATQYPGDRIGGTLLDVWHKPTIKPCMLTQAETAVLMKSGDYCGEKFDAQQHELQGHPEEPFTVYVNDHKTQVEFGKKGFAIRETPEMYGARLLEDIHQRPDYYFQRREITRLPQELDEFEHSLYAIYQAQKLMGQHRAWFENENQCRATFQCPFIPICYGPGANAVCDGKITPVGFKRIFVTDAINTPVSPEEP